MRSDRGAFYGLVALLALIFAAWWYFFATQARPGTMATSTPPLSINRQNVTDGMLTFSYRLDEFGLATSPEQIQVRPYIPPCDQDFDYCLYYIGSDYQGTNFETAGLRIKKRADLPAIASCLTAQPEGYEELMPTIVSSSTYSTSIFSPLGDAGAGHYAHGELYRFSSGTSCYEFETRIGASQYDNYEQGAIEKFTVAQEAQMRARLLSILDDVRLETDERIVFPAKE